LPTEFDAIYDLVDETFGFKRSRAHNDWLYRRNPYGLARCWVVYDRAGGQLVSSMASWPWPIAHGTHRVEGMQDGDAVVAPRWQRQGIDRLRTAAWHSHAWDASNVTMSWPNEKSRGAGRKRGRSFRMMGPVPQAAMILNADAFMAEYRFPALLRVAIAPLSDAALGAWRMLTLHEHSGLAIEAVRRFDASFDEVTEQCMSWSGFWSPHDAEFLNWRYFAHPTAHFVAFALSEQGELAGYYVLKIDGQSSWLMEFVLPRAPRARASMLLSHAIDTARAAGCTHVKFSAPPRWRHWKLFRSVGFLPLPSRIYLWPGGESAGLTDINMWQWVPGDMDYL
jgi:hypothetical protein